MAYGAGGMLAGFVFAEGRLPRKPVVMGIFGFLAVAFFVGPLLDTCSVFLVKNVSFKGAMMFYVYGFPVNMRQAGTTAIVLLVLGKPLLEKLDRIKTKYGILDDEGREEAGKKTSCFFPPLPRTLLRRPGGTALGWKSRNTAPRGTWMSSSRRPTLL